MYLCDEQWLALLHFDSLPTGHGAKPIFLFLSTQVMLVVGKPLPIRNLKHEFDPWVKEISWGEGVTTHSSILV